MSYYHNLVVEKSWKELQRLKEIVAFVLIGGWAVWLYTKALKSKDIDIIIDFPQLKKFSDHYELSKNERLKKYQAVREEVEIDIYLPYYSHLGIPVENLLKHTQSLEGFRVLSPDYLLAIKIYTFSKRERTVKGKKDFLDIVSLLRSNWIEFERLRGIVKEYGLQKELEVFKNFFQSVYELPELDFTKHSFAKFKKKVLEIVSKHKTLS